MQTHIYSFCTLKHLNVWQKTSELLPKNVPADEYFVYVPDQEVKEFKKFTNSAVTVLSEDVLSQKFAQQLKVAVDKSGNVNRYGWYLQQFLKIESLVSSRADLMAIWDSDCVPVKKIDLFNDEHVPIYSKSSEYHKEYFKVIKKILGLSKIQDHSFIIPGFPFTKNWITEFINELELRHSGLKWGEILIQEINFGLISGFSEFETLGTWISNRHRSEFEYREYSWERFGQSRFGTVSEFSSHELIKLGEINNLDVISFENWDSIELKKKNKLFKIFSNISIT